MATLDERVSNIMGSQIMEIARLQGIVEDFQQQIAQLTVANEELQRQLNEFNTAATIDTFDKPSPKKKLQQ